MAAQPSSEGGGHFRLLEASSALARRQLAEQASLLGDAQQRVESLVGAQQRLRDAVVGEESATGPVEAEALAPPAAEPAVSAASPPLSPKKPGGEGDASKVVRLRELLGASVRTQSEQTGELAAIRSELAEERSVLQSIEGQHRRDMVALREAEDLVKSLSEQLSTVQLTAQENGQADRARIAQLEGRIAEMDSQNETRLALERASQREEEPGLREMIAVAAPETPASDVPIGGLDL